MRESGLDIATASEVMAAPAPARDLDDLRERLGRMAGGYTGDGGPGMAEAGTAVALDVRGKPRPARVVPLPFVPPRYHKP